MNYNKKYYSLERAISREKYFNNKPLFFKNGIDSNKIFFDYILEHLCLLKDRGKKTKVLDIGTGTGYVPQILCHLSKENFEIIGIDLSQEMIGVAKKKENDKRIKYFIADNNKLPFKNESFDIVTNKLSTRFNLKEVYRVLRKGGAFVFKEYGKGGGFKEIAQIFKTRYKRTDKNVSDYILDMSKMGFEFISINLFQIKRKYSQEDIKDIFSMANLIDKFDNKDLVKILKKLMKNGLIEVTSDPFVIFAKK